LNPAELESAYAEIQSHFAPLAPHEDDLTQEAFARFTLALRRPVDNPLALLRRIAWGVRADHFRAQYRDADRDEYSGGSPAWGMPWQSAFADDLNDALDDLPTDTRAVFALTELRGLTQTETAAVLGMSRDAVKRRAARALSHLQEAL
jgi:RNA polymerase sigma factor (sigma-70 family)